MMAAAVATYLRTALFLAALTPAGSLGFRYRRDRPTFQPVTAVVSGENQRFTCISIHVKNNGTVCGHRHCCCNDTYADCSGKNLSYIPQLNQTKLDFSYNLLTDLSKEILKNISSVAVLILDHNNLTSIHQDAFKSITGLKHLSLDFNYLNDSDSLFAALTKVLSLKTLSVVGNGFHSLNLSRVMELPTLRYLTLRNNFIRSVTKSDVVTANHSLVSLNVSGNQLMKFPEFCADQNMPVFPSLQFLNLEWNKITSLDNMQCLPNVTDLIISGNAIYHTRRNFLRGLPSLRTLYYKTCTSRFIDDHAFNHSGLEHLDVSENVWFFDHFYGAFMSMDLFQGMPSLKTVNISWTVLHFSNESEKYRVLSPLSHVKDLIMQGTGISSIPQVILTHFASLENLNVGINQIPYLPDNTFQNLTSLRRLTISYNYMTTFSQTLLQPLLNRNQTTEFDFSGNPFSCQCDLKWMMDLFREQKNGDHVVFRNRKFYICTYPPNLVGFSLANVTLAGQACLLDYSTYVAILFVTIFALVLILVGTLLYRFRWQCRFLVYTLQHRCSARQGEKVVSTPAVYDVFVSYDSNDSQWVHQVLQKELEDNRRLRLCLHQRDFAPGMFISHNIIERLEESRAILLVLSNAFLKSEWCRFEMFLGVKSGLAHSKMAVVPVLLEELDKALVDSFVCTLLQTTTYIAWPVSGSGQDTAEFWRNLCRVISRGQRVIAL